MSADTGPTIDRPTSDIPTADGPTADDATAGQPVAVAPGALDALDALPDLPADTWPTGRPVSGIRVPVPVAGLALLLVALLGAAGGARLKSAEVAPTGAGGARNPAAVAAAGGPGGFTGRGGAAGGAVAGTVKAVDGDKVTVTGADGQESTFTIGDDTTVTKTESGDPADIQPGQTLTVRGTAGADGTTAAASVVIGALPTGGARTAAPSTTTP